MPSAWFWIRATVKPMLLGALELTPLCWGAGKEHRKEDGQALRGNGKLTPEQEEIRRLKQENRQ